MVPHRAKSLLRSNHGRHFFPDESLPTAIAKLLEPKQAAFQTARSKIGGGRPVARAQPFGLPALPEIRVCPVRILRLVSIDGLPRDALQQQVYEVPCLPREYELVEY